MLLELCVYLTFGFLLRKHLTNGAQYLLRNTSCSFKRLMFLTESVCFLHTVVAALPFAVEVSCILLSKGHYLLSVWHLYFPPFHTNLNIKTRSVSALNYAGACVLFCFQPVLLFLCVYYGSLTFFAAFGWHVSHEETILSPQITCNACQCWRSILVSSIESPFFKKKKQQWILLNQHSYPSLLCSQ